MNSTEFVSLDDVFAAESLDMDGMLELSDEYLMLIHGGSSLSPDSSSTDSGVAPSAPSQAGFLGDVAKEVLVQLVVEGVKAVVEHLNDPPEPSSHPGGSEGAGGASAGGGGGAGGASGQ